MPYKEVGVKFVARGYLSNQANIFVSKWALRTSNKIISSLAFFCTITTLILFLFTNYANTTGMDIIQNQMLLSIMIFFLAHTVAFILLIVPITPDAEHFSATFSILATVALFISVFEAETKITGFSADRSVPILLAVVVFSSLFANLFITLLTAKIEATITPFKQMECWYKKHFVTIEETSKSS